MDLIEKNMEFKRSYEEHWLNKIEIVINKFDDFDKDGDCYTWKNINSIVSILKEIGKEDTHLFLPLSGGNHFNDCKLSSESGFIDLIAQGVYRVLPKQLKLYRRGDINWDYFILETEKCNRKLDFEIKGNEVSEELIESRYGEYIEYSDGKYEELIEAGKNVDNMKVIERVFKSVKYAIFNEYSLYNNDNFTLIFKKVSAYDSLQNKLSSKEFNELIGFMKSVYDESLKDYYNK